MRWIDYVRHMTRQQWQEAGALFALALLLTMWLASLPVTP